jgi:hypothetical protein
VSDFFLCAVRANVCLITEGVTAWHHVRFSSVLVCRAYLSPCSICGSYAEYWQPWSEVVNATSGLPKQLTYLSRFNLTL